MAMIHLEPQTAQMFSRALGTLKPPPNLTLSQWADNYRRLSAEASAAQGRWNTDNAPFQREIMDAIGDVHIRKVVAMMCAQSGKTDGLILNTIGYYMSYYPAPIMIVQPTVNLGESFSKDRLATMIRDTPVLRGLVDNKSRYSGNTIMKKNFAGGQLTIVGANAPTDLRGRPIKVLLADEVDAYKASAGKEGDPVMLAEQRQTTYWDYKTVLVSTPTDKNNSRILDEFNASTQEEWTVPCPNCGFYQPFVWDNMVFDKDKWPEGGVQYRCAECGCLDNEYRWKKNSLKGKWHAEHPERAVRGFHMNKIGSTKRPTGITRRCWYRPPPTKTTAAFWTSSTHPPKRNGRCLARTAAFISPLFGTTWYSIKTSGRKAACNTAAPSAAALTTNTAGRRTA